jgi:orotate phosphoribosyltransferase
MTYPAFDDFIIEHDILGFFAEPLTLNSGRKSHFYVNWRKATNDAFLLDRLSDYLVSFIQKQALVCDTLYGVPEGASKTAVITAMKLARQSPQFGLGSHTIAMGRAKPKPHGDPADRFFIGQPKGRTYVLEDTITTGLSLFQCLDQLLEAGIDVQGVICLTDRCELRDDGSTVREYLSQRYARPIPYLPMRPAPELVRLAIAKHRPAASVIATLAAELGLPPEQLQAPN